MADRPYLFYELTNAICSTCYRKVEAKIVIEGERVFMHKFCPTHGRERVLISTDAAFYKQQRHFLKPGQLVKQFNTPIRYGCPYDCGICPDHEQHGCLTIVEITDHCNLTCPVCYADSGPHRPAYRSLEQVAFMLDCVVRNEGEPDIVQISGGEPTLHPAFFEILDAARRRPIKHLMVNTNGIRLAQDEAFVERLAGYMPGFEVYLQFDSLRPEVLRDLRGMDLRTVHDRALERLDRFNISTTLVVTLKKGLNDDEIGAIVNVALQYKCVRGVTLQPIQVAGRTERVDPARDRLTLGEVRQQLLRQVPWLKPADVLPVPCHPDCLAMAYALKLGGEVIPLTGLIDPQLLLDGEGNTITYERQPAFREHLFKTFSTGHAPASQALSLKQLLCCLPLVGVPETLTYENVFRLLIVQFMDAYNLDIRSVKRSCVHIVHPDGRIIPFDTFNLFYRDEREARLVALRRGVLPDAAALPDTPSAEYV
ncbi:MAG: radical SAM protein [Chloracidobacterium sp.]|uniref:Radical SAM protein n=1 Tax=Chloracidobacterium validum TaxID=2821543 RepID=A0ABX8B7U0_9BACT|nr:radical SAM protein [Chloracidobacterium validum]QUW03026.1 radical SAM protein [Chloracidobacterium validum]